MTLIEGKMRHCDVLFDYIKSLYVKKCACCGIESFDLMKKNHFSALFIDKWKSDYISV